MNVPAVDVPNPATGTAGWLMLDGGPVYAVWHEPSSPRSAVGTAVLMIPPFGWDDVVAHRARRYWAIRLAEAGLPALRYDLPGTAESPGDGRDPDLVHRWVGSVVEAATRLRERTGAERLAAVGIGLGGLLASAALADGAPIDDLILWGARSRGRTMVRELRAYAGVVASEFPEDAAGPAPDDGIDVTGYLLSHATAEALSAIDIATLTVPERPGRRALLLSRDDLGIDPKLADALRDFGFDVTEREVGDYGALMTHPQAVDLRRPEATIGFSLDWLAAAVSAPTPGVPAPGPPTSGRTGAAGPPAEPFLAPRCRMTDADGPLETVLNTTLGGERATVVVTQPDGGQPRAPIGVLLLNSGSIRKTGPHRLWVQLARRWAERGLVVARADFGAVGDSACPSDSGADERPYVLTETLTSPDMIGRTQELIAQLRAAGFMDRILCVGHCSGAYLGFHCALEDERIVGFSAVNQQAFIYTSDLFQERMFDRILTVARTGVVKRLREQGLTANEVRQILDAVRHRYRRKRDVSPEVRQYRDGLALLDRLRDRGTRVLMLFSQEGELHELLFGPVFQGEYATGRWPNAVIEQLPTQDHMARAIWLQQHSMARLERGLDELLVAMGAADRPVPAPT